MTDIAILHDAEGFIRSYSHPNNVPASDYIIVDLAVSLSDPDHVSSDDIVAIVASTAGKKVDIINGVLTNMDADEVIRWGNIALDRAYSSVKELQSALGDLAVETFEAMIALVTDPKKYKDEEKISWSKQEKTAECFLSNWNYDNPTYSIIAQDQSLPANERKYQILVNLISGELKIAKDLVTDNQAKDKSESILLASSSISPYYAALLGTLHSVINDLQSIYDDYDATTITETQARAQMLLVDITVIEAVAAAELGL